MDTTPTAYKDGYRPRGFAQKARTLLNEAVVGVGSLGAQQDDIVSLASEIFGVVDELVDMNTDVEQIKMLGDLMKLCDSIKDKARSVKDQSRAVQETLARIPVEAG